MSYISETTVYAYWYLIKEDAGTSKSHPLKKNIKFKNIVWAMRT